VGAVVYIADVADGSSLAAELTSGGPGSAVFVRTDVGDEESVRDLVSTVIGERGRIDVLVNNAALFAALPPVPYDQIGLELWDRVMRVNLAVHDASLAGILRVLGPIDDRTPIREVPADRLAELLQRTSVMSKLRAGIDLTRPVCLLMGALLHFFPAPAVRDLVAG
jgi:NAD(P)-dependent dehydrogenase (short-subunit alcohol dehydrogenase family)